MKNYQYVLDIETPFIRKLYDKEDNYKVELLTPYGILEELKKLQEENANLEAKLAEWQDGTIICKWAYAENKVEELEQQLAEKERLLRKYVATSCPILQDKISFCIEKLEKVKEWAIGFYGEYSAGVIVNYIDNQIKQLKEMK